MTQVVNALKLGEFDAGPIQSELEGLTGSSLWWAHVNRSAYVGSWQALALTAPQEHSHSHPLLQLFSIEESDVWVELAVLDRLPATRALLASLPGERRSARLMALEPGAHILPHRDAGVCIEQGQARLQLCVALPRGLSFDVAGETLPMQQGEIWYINADAPHQVSHQGTERRLSLVVDMNVTPEFRRWVELSAP
ncbi:aspartyl/asparaginyl beta-hydroxylase domain-containing protein [Ferrimonas sp. YFM]|uniref:aspartyl/asparaginyl beta-hydroxylase domain-containing protein n=1 Tax=Ferrimonas sp. YFM TaxID=3028878 RepID=UPI0025731B39|nr:aspartyl/asparaginyl beta-hydroxylase domain-containing protein [Ferrimonas sp. YFM]BDY05995.1 aspartyl/asparaginyl beta-hydroxylase [Ferrimonas sp. YFM]